VAGAARTGRPGVAHSLRPHLHQAALRGMAAHPVATALRFGRALRPVGEVPVVAGQGDEMAVDPAGRGRMRASHADREQAIEVLKAAFVQDRLTKDELDARTGRALAARTCAELAAVSAGIPPAPAAAGQTRPPTPARRRPLAGAAAKSGICLIITAAAIGVGGYLDPNGLDPNPLSSGSL
jgi:Domain of unknown function (DUF1707)